MILLDDYVIVMWMFKAVLSLINSQAPTHESLSPPYTSGNTEDTCMSVHKSVETLQYPHAGLLFLPCA